MTVWPVRFVGRKNNPNFRQPPPVWMIGQPNGFHTVTQPIL